MFLNTYAEIMQLDKIFESLCFMIRINSSEARTNKLLRMALYLLHWIRKCILFSIYSLLQTRQVRCSWGLQAVYIVPAQRLKGRNHNGISLVQISILTLKTAKRKKFFFFCFRVYVPFLYRPWVELVYSELLYPTERLLLFFNCVRIQLKLRYFFVNGLLT